METHAQTVARWTKSVKKSLVGRTITDVRYLSKKEMNDLGWTSQCVVLVLDDGNLLFPSRDDEGNDAGALFTNDENLPVIPVIRDYGAIS